MSHVRDIRHMAGRTPAGRDRSVDLLRALAICVVVIGHWLAVVVTTRDGIEGSTALSYLGWAHPVTWVLQVMPVFFLVGGFANGASLTSHQRRGGDAFGWLLNRGARLLRPTTAFLLLLAAAGFGARALGAEPRLVGLGIWAASIPLWFLVAYLGLVFLAPALHAAHARFGLAFPAAVIVAVLVLDVARLQFDVPLVAGTNYLLVWLVFHQVGMAWQDGTINPQPAACASLAVAGVITLVLLTTLGPYPVSMVNVPENEVYNTSPPTAALLVLGLTQAAAALAFSSKLDRWLQRSQLWTGVVAVNAVILTVFLWHMAAAVITASITYPSGILPEPPVESGRWLLWRLPWLVGCAAVLAVLVAVFFRIETNAARSSRVLTVPSERTSDTGSHSSARSARSSSGRVAQTVHLRRPSSWFSSRTALRGAIVVGTAAVVGGLLLVALADRTFDGVGGLPVWALVLYLSGAGVLGLIHRHHARPG